MSSNRISRPGINETLTLVFLAAVACTPALALAINNDRAALIVFVILALSFWFPIGQIIFVAVRGYKSGGAWEWPRLTGGPKFHMNHRRY